MVEFENLRGLLFARAERVEAAGAPIVWRVRGQDLSAVAPAVHRVGTDLGVLRRNEYGRRDPLSDGSLHLLQLGRSPDGADLLLAETWEGTDRLTPRRRAHGRPVKLKEWLTAAFDGFVGGDRATDALAAAGDARGPFSCLVQAGLSDRDLIGWLAAEVTRLARVPVVPVGRPGSAWELAALRPEGEPRNLDPTPAVVGYGPAPLGPLARASGSRGGCWVARRSGPFIAAGWAAERAADRVPFSVALPGGGRVAVARRDRFLQGGRDHVRDYYLLDDPAGVCPAAGPVVPAVLAGTAGSYDAGRWTLPCTLTGFEPDGAAVDALLTTPWGGPDGVTGWHPVPGENCPVLLCHPGTLDGIPYLFPSPRPESAGGDDDVRSLGVAAIWGRGDLVVRADGPAGLRVRGSFAVGEGRTATIAAADEATLRTAARAIVCGNKIDFQ